jgi:hypothetical protein
MHAAAATKIELTTIETIEREGGSLLAEHYDEIAKHKDVMVLHPRWDVYQQAQRAGHLFCLAAFVDDVMVGYSVTFVTQHLHYGLMTYAQNDVLFVSPPHRSTANGRLGVRLIHETEVEAKERGAQLMLWHAKEHSKLSLLLAGRGQYAVQDIIYSRKL